MPHLIASITLHYQQQTPGFIDHRLEINNGQAKIEQMFH